MRRELGLFTIGGGAYVLLELLYRSRSHWTMFVLGGGCFLALGRLQALPLGKRMLWGSGVCTAGELIFGLTFNRDHSIWDYRSLPLNFRGQICLGYSLAWMGVSLLAGELYRLLERGGTKP